MRNILFSASLIVSGLWTSVCLAKDPAVPKPDPLAPVRLPAIGLTAFAEIPPVSPALPKPALIDGATTLDKAPNGRAVLQRLNVKLSDAQRKYLDAHKFILIPIEQTKLKTDPPVYDGYDDMLTAFDLLGGSDDSHLRKPENTKFVTPDVVLHAFHKFLENSLEQLEGTDLNAALERFLTAAQAAALRGATAATDKELAGRFETLAAQWTVPLILLRDKKDNAANALSLLAPLKGKFTLAAFDAVTQELGFVYRANEVRPSPLFGLYDSSIQSDYTQFKPRSHYTKTPALRAYFRAMMYLGRNGYALETIRPDDSPRGLADSLLAACVLAGAQTTNGAPALNDWQHIMEVTGFFVGAPDDLTYADWRDYLVATLGEEPLDPARALDAATLGKLKENLGKLRSPDVSSEAVGRRKGERMTAVTAKKSVRLFPQRFTFDAWVLSHLSGDPSIPETAHLPSLPSALFVAAALGGTAAEEFSAQYLTRVAAFEPEKVERFKRALGEVRDSLAKLDDKAWFAAVGSEWLRVLGNLTANYGEGYPLYMRDEAFGAKQLQTLLGSFAELKHDTLLYAKQAYSEYGAGEEEGVIPPMPKGFVEPNVAFWHELQRMARYTLDGFKHHRLLPVVTEEGGTLPRFVEDVNFLTGLAEKELAGAALKTEEYERLRNIGLSYMAAPLEPGKVLDAEAQHVALIADIHTDIISKKTLYEATGQPYVMLALVGNEKAPRVVIGLTYNHYEMALPLGERMSDEDWRQKVYRPRSALPEKNFWYDALRPR